MRDFAAHVRANLPRACVPDDGYEKVVDELAGELETLYTAARTQGASEADAWAKVIAQIPSWSALADEISGAVPGSRHKTRRHTRIAWIGWLTPERWRHDVIVSLRALRKDWAFGVTAVVTLAVCLGGNAAIIPAVDSILLHPLRVPEPEGILLMANQYPRVEARRGIWSATPDYEDRLHFVTALEEQALYNFTGETMDTGGIPTRTLGIIATPSLLRVLRITPQRGRIFSEDEGTLGNDRRVILTDGLWRERYGADPAIIGRSLRLSGKDFIIVGVLPRTFSFGSADVRFWIPLALTERQRSDEARQSNGWFSVGRLKPGTSIGQVRDQLKALDAANLERFPQFRTVLVNLGFYTSVEPLQDVLVRNVKGPLTVLWIAALTVLVIGLANLGHLALARSRVRLHEFGTRLAIGARRRDIVRQLLVEGWLVAGAGTIAGVAFGVWIVMALQASRLTVIHDLATDTVSVALVSAIVVLGTLVGTLIALISALPLFTTRVGTMLREDSRRGLKGRAARTARRVLVVAQVACSFVLLVGAGLLWVSLRALLATDVGFRTDNIITGMIALPRARYAADDDARAFVNRSFDAIRHLPGVTAAGASTVVPLSGNYSSGPIIAEGYVPKPGESPVGAIRAWITPGYFEAIGMPLVRGRYFDERDDLATTTTIVIDERLARRFWGDTDPIGRRVYQPRTLTEMTTATKGTRWLTVVGVVGHARLRGVEADDDLPAVYLPYPVIAPRDFGFVIRTAADPVAIVPRLRSLVASIDREIPLTDVRTLTERTEISLAGRTTTMQLSTLFAFVAMLLSAVGLYGVLTYLVTRRTHEIGVRVAIGSTPARIVGLVLREGLGLAFGGIAFGIITVLALRRVAMSYLYGLAPADPLIMTLVALALASLGLIACAYPARRAARVDAIQVLKA